MPKHVLLTGATGLVGSAVLLELLARGHRVTAVARGADDDDARARVIAALVGEECAGPDRLRVVAGDVTAGGLGVEPGWLGQADVLVHAAADTSFIGSGGGENVNVGGTERALAVAARVGIERFHHVSTAFIAGDLPRFTAEDFDLGQGFRNDYERTKFQAERLLRQASHPFGVTVHRPGVVLGSSATGRSPTFRGLYPLLGLVCKIAASSPNGASLPLAAGVDPEGRRHLLCADDLARAIVCSVERLHDAPLQTLHHVPEHPLTNARFATLLERALGVAGFAVGKSRETSAGIAEALAPYVDYLDGEPELVPSPTGARGGVDITAMRRILEFGARVRWRSAGAGSGRPAARAQSSARAYVEEDLLSRVGTELVPGVASKSASFRVVVGDDSFSLRIVSGILESARWQPPAAESYEFCIRLTAPILDDLLAGRRECRESFFAGDIDIDGDIEAALSLTPLIQAFLSRSPVA